MNDSTNSSISLLELNPAQQKAVTAAQNSVLVLAGAGSGKTRVLTQRVEWLIRQGVSNNHIMAVTFTNKAANEMRHRLEGLLGASLKRMWLGTFHGLAHRFLRLHWQEAAFDQNFQILDADDQYRLLRRIHKELNLDEEKWPAKQSQAFINKNKDLCLRPEHVKAISFSDVTLVKIYQAYSEICKRGSLVDFAELLLRTYEVLKEQPYILQEYKQRFKHILIDEFQDTNSLQYLWIKALALGSSNLMVVGDDDQSIYGWRGANVENIQHLLQDFPQTEIIRLEQNYRSTGAILKAANAVIANNQNRLGKNLWTEGRDGELITLYAAYNEVDEAKYVIDKIKKIKTDNGSCKLGDVAILYRSNAQSRLFEEQCINAQIPYRIHGGLRFFERAEIKDVLAYLRVVVNSHDDASLERIINVPTRGIGETTLILLRNYAISQQIPLFVAIQEMVAKKMLAARPLNAVINFLNLLQLLKEKINQLEFPEFFSYVIKTSGLYDYYAKDKSERDLMRVDNLEELVNAAKEFELGSIMDKGEEATEATDNNRALLIEFLANAALEAGEAERQGTSRDECVHLMTLHAAKGLEFNTIFLCGLEEGLFPHIMSMEGKGELEEERRLCYVGITRARFKLYCTYAESRRWHGVTSLRFPSRFLREIPPELIDEETSLISSQPLNFNINDDVSINIKANKFINNPISDNSVSNFSIGQIVKHQKFGDGIVIGREGQGEHLLVQIKFTRCGVKWISPQYAKLDT